MPGVKFKLHAPDGAHPALCEISVDGKPIDCTSVIVKLEVGKPTKAVLEVYIDELDIHTEVDPADPNAMQVRADTALRAFARDLDDLILDTTDEKKE